MAIGKILYKSFYWRVFQWGSSFLVNILFARMLRASLSAELYSLVYLFSIFTSFFTLGLDIGLNYFISRGELSSALARRIIGGVTAVAVVTSLLLVFIGHGLIHDPGISLPRLLLFSGCQIAGTLLVVLSGAFFTAYGRNHIPAKIGCLFNVLVVALALAEDRVYHGRQAIDNLFLLYFLLSLGQGVVLFLLTARYSGRRGEDPKKDVSPGFLLRYCSVSFITNLIFFLGGRVALFLLPYRVPTSDLGNYIQVYKIVEYMSMVAAFLYYPFITLVATEDRDKMNEKALMLVRLSNTAVLMVTLMILVLGPFLFPFVFGSSFSQMPGIFLWFIPGLFAACSSTFFTAWYFGAGHIRYNLMSACLQMGAAIMLFFLLTPAWGVRGAAMGYSGAALLSMGYDCLLFRKFYHYKPADLLLIQRNDWHILRTFKEKWLKGRERSAKGGGMGRST
jgi:O-antigen/teichoic acid export membrane protein